MKALLTYLFVCTLAMAFALPTAAQTVPPASDAPSSARPLTMDQVLDRASQNNPEIRAAVRRVTVAQSKTAGAGALADPMFSYRNWGTPIVRPWDANQAQNMFMLQQTFPPAGKRAAQKELAGKQVDIAKDELEAVRQEVALRTRKAFIDLLRNADELRTHDKQSALVHDALQSALSKYTVGKAPQQDVLKAQIAITKLKDHLIRLGLERDLARTELNALLGTDPADMLMVVGSYTPPGSLPSLLELETLALQNRPELAAARKQMEASGVQTRIAQLGNKPDYTVGAGYMVMPSGTMSRNAYMAELSVSLPWLNRTGHDAEISESTSMTEMNRAELSARTSEVFSQIQQALIKVRASQKSLSLYRDTLFPQTEATLKAALVAYQNDRADFLSLIDSQNMMLEVETSTFTAAAELDARYAELERAVGTQLANASRGTEKN